MTRVAGRDDEGCGPGWRGRQAGTTRAAGPDDEAAGRPDARLRELYDEVSGYPFADDDTESEAAQASPFEVPIRVRTPGGVLSMFSTMATFGAPPT